MAITARVRIRPDVFSDKTQVEGADPAAGTGQILFSVEVCVYDDTVVTAGNYSAGDPATEKNINVVWTDSIRGDLATLSAMTNAQFNAWLASQVDAWATANKQLVTNAARLRYLAAKMVPRAIP